MSVMVVTSLGDLVIDLFTDRCPLTCKNFLKLCNKATQSVGLLSYSYLRLTGQDDVIVPMVDYDISNHWAEPITYGSLDDWTANLNTILEWSPFASKEELMMQFEGIGAHGTKVIIYNLWLNDEGIYELSFDDDDEDIKLKDETSSGSKVNKQTALLHSHICYRLRFHYGYIDQFSRCLYVEYKNMGIDVQCQKLPGIIGESSALFHNVKTATGTYMELEPFQKALDKGEAKDICAYTHGLRWVKSPAELHLMRQASSIGCQALLRTMFDSKTYPHEGMITAKVEYECKMRDAQRMA